MNNTNEKSIVSDAKNHLIRRPSVLDRYARAEGMVIYWYDGDRQPLEIDGNVIYRYDPVSQSYEIMKKNIAGPAESSYDHLIINRDDISYIDIKRSEAAREVFEKRSVELERMIEGTL